MEQKMIGYDSLKDILLDTDSDKQSVHRYGFLYDLLFNSLALKKQDQLNILEIGVSKFGNGSLSAWQQSDLVKRAVGIDVIDYKGQMYDKGVFYKLDAYSADTVTYLKEIEGAIFDIIIDDGIHQQESQRWFLDNYSDLLVEGGYLICEDVSSLKLITEQCENDNVFCVDGWANRGISVKSYNNDKNLYSHDERILIKAKSVKLTDVKKHESKQHIAKLPDIAFPDYERNSTELAVSIPLFYSDLDTQYDAFDVQRFQDIHCKGAVWAGMSFIHNSDLGDRGTPIYFHIEDKAWDYAMPVFEKYEVPSEWIRKITAPTAENEYNVNKTHFGKKFIPLLDTEIDADVLLILDSDAFTLATGDKLKLYDKLTSTPLKSQPSMTYFEMRRLPYYWWVSMVCLASGMPDKLVYKKKLGELEREAYKRLGFDKQQVAGIKANDKVQRFFAENYMITFPKGHAVRQWTIDRIPTCYTSPYIHAVWAEYNQVFLELGKILELPVYDWESNFIQGKHGYNCLAHIRVDKSPKNMSKPSLVHHYWDKFYEHITRHINISSEE